MSSLTGSIAIWDIRAGEIDLRPNRQAPDLLALDVSGDVHIVLNLAGTGAAEEAQAMRRLAQVAAEAAGKLEHRATARGQDGAEGGDGNG